MDFSVIIPTYNRSQILALTLDALAQQSSTLNSEEPLSFEVVVIDDGSTDSTREHVKAQIQNYPVPLRYFFQTNRKQAAARNFGASKAYGTFLLFLGDDIVPCQNFLHEHRKSHNSRDPNLAAIGYAIAILITGLKLPHRPIILETIQTNISALCITIQTVAATKDTPERINISGPPSTSPVMPSNASKGRPKNISKLMPINVMDIRFWNSSLYPRYAIKRRTISPKEIITIVAPIVTIAALS